ncbi:MAG: TetR/AcrR family transcriptional regulator [Mycobacterium sp.]
MDDNTTRRGGRPSLVLERKRQIVDAFIDLVADRGLEHVTLDDVAMAAGVQRAALRHFVGNREQLIDAAVIELCRRYELTVRATVGESPSITALINILFSDDWTRDNSAEDAAFEVLLAEAVRQPDTRGAIKTAYEMLLDEIASALRRGHPDAPIARIRDTAYVIACLVEQNTTFQQLGYPRARQAAARTAALLVVSDLGGQGSGPR